MSTPLSLVAHGCGCDLAPGLISVDRALELLAGAVAAVPEAEPLAPAHAVGRVLARGVRAATAVPPFDNAAMDGYALNAASLRGDGPWVLPVTGRIAAGSAASGAPAHGAVRIFTGAPLPAGADCVLMQETVARAGDSIRLTERPVPGTHLRRAGEDMAPGAEVLPAGRRLDAVAVAVAAAAGAGVVRARRRLRVALLTTGDEVTGAGAALAPGGIRDANGPMLTAALARPDVELVLSAHIADDRDALRDTFAAMSARADLIVTTGGVSVGEEDHLHAAFADAGGRGIFAGVAMKPGKPVSAGQIGGAVWLGLPGNPVSAHVCWTLFGLPLLDHLSGAVPPPRRRHAVLDAPLAHRPGRCEFRPATLAGHDGTGREVVRAGGPVQSARLSVLAGANGLILIPSETDGLAAGDLVEYLPFSAS